MIIMDCGENQAKTTKVNRTFADFSIETLLKKEDNPNHRRKSWGIVQNPNQSSLQPTVRLCFEENYHFNCCSNFEYGTNISLRSESADAVNVLETQAEEEDELISVSDDNNEEPSDGRECKILNNNALNEDSSSDSTFAWLTCTRFKPPKLPRPRRKSTSRKHGRGPRIPFSSHQLAVLESTFVNSQYLSSDAIGRLAENLNLTETRVKIWFQNRRARYRREKECSPFSSRQGKASSSPISPKQERSFTTSYDFSCVAPSPNHSPNKKQSLRHLINDLNLMAATVSAKSNDKSVLNNLGSYLMSEEDNILN